MNRRFLTVTALVALVGVLALAATANGRDRVRYPSVVTIHKDAPALHGDVRVRKPAQHPRVAGPCQTRRVVKLYRLHNGHHDLVGTDRTNQKGRWAVPVHGKKGRYVAFAKRRPLPQLGHRVCAGGFSRTVRL
jgi:hypothetical protein